MSTVVLTRVLCNQNGGHQIGGASCRMVVSPREGRGRAGAPSRPPKPVPRCGSVGYDPGGSSVLPRPHVATAYVSQRVLRRSVVNRCSSPTVAPRRPLHHSPPPRPYVSSAWPALSPPPAPPHHPGVIERRCPAAGGVKHARSGVRQGVITHHPLVPSSTHDGQGHAPITRACVAPRAA